MKKLLFLFAFTLTLIGSIDAQYLYRPTVVSADTLTNADSTIFTLPSGNELGSTFPNGALISWTVYTKAVSGTTTSLVAYPESTNFTTSLGFWDRDYASKDTLQIVASTFTQEIPPYVVYNRNARLVIKHTGTAVRIVRVAASIRKNPFVISE